MFRQGSLALVARDAYWLRAHGYRVNPRAYVCEDSLTEFAAKDKRSEAELATWELIGDCSGVAMVKKLMSVFCASGKTAVLRGRCLSLCPASADALALSYRIGCMCYALPYS